MKKRLFVLLSLLIILSLTLTSTAIGQTPTTTPDRPGRNLQEVPEEIQALFKDGIPISEFLALNKGPVPRALEEFSKERVTVILEMEGEPLAAVYSASQLSRSPMSATSQQQYAAALREAQAPVVASLARLGGSVISQYTRAYNGILVNLPAAGLAEVQRQPGVKAIRRAPLHHIELENSVPLIRADDVVDVLGYDGSGITVAVIDTGIDYNHAALGGSGNPADYAANDPDVIETGTFPTVKVVGGYDFAGTNYDASSDDPTIYTPGPDPDPLDENGHGTHVASTAAGIGVTGTIGEGVAPAASLYALKVFGFDGSTNLTVDAIEWAMDPNGDSNLDDHVDVINMSLGSDYAPNDPADPDIVASNMASAIGVVVVASAGNAGDTPYITGTPGGADSVISVAASTTGFVSGPEISIQPGGTPSTLYQPSSFDGNTGHFTSTITAPLFDAGTLSVPDTLCDITGVTPNIMSGDIALIQRGTCDFYVKVNNAGVLGAVGAIIYNHTTGGDSLVTMGGSPVTIPGGFIGHSAGVTLTTHHGENLQVSAEDLLTTIADPNVDPDTIADFSSRGPRGFDSILKPEITAPGVAIVAANMGGGDTARSLNGTSMAAPHVAGVAALIREAHPTWTPAQVKAAMMNSAVDLADPFSAETPRQGAGRVDAYESVTADGFLVGDPGLVSLNWGLISTSADSYTASKNLSLTNLDTSGKVYSVTWDFAPGSYASGFDMTLPPTVTVGPGPSAATIPVDLVLDTTLMVTDFGGFLEEYYGNITLTNAAAITDTLRIPFYSVVQPYAELDLAGSVTQLSPPSGEVQITHSGPITSSLWAYPLLAMDPNEPGVGDEADLRMFGMDYGWDDATYGDIFVPAFNTYGAWHTPQPYFAEIDMDFDIDGDGVVDLTDFNFNYGWWLGTDDTDEWIVVQIDWTVGLLFLGSPYLILTDYHAGFMEWYLVADWHYLGSSGDTDFGYEVFGFDYEGNGDFGGSGEFDYAMLPFLWGLSTLEPGPGDPVATLTYEVDDPAGYALASPLGLMVVDYNGQGGAGQAYAFETPLKIHLPVMKKQ